MKHYIAAAALAVACVAPAAAETSLMDTQKIDIRSDGWWQALNHNYHTGVSSSAPAQSFRATFNCTIPVEQWKGFFVYDFQDAAFVNSFSFFYIPQ